MGNAEAIQDLSDSLVDEVLNGLWPMVKGWNRRQDDRTLMMRRKA
jgi:hypothetical protein